MLTDVDTAPAQKVISEIITEFEPLNGMRKSPSLPYYYTLSNLRNSVSFPDNVILSANKSCVNCKILDELSESLLSELENRTLALFNDSISSFLKTPENRYLPRCCLPFTEVLYAKCCSIFLRLWSETLKCRRLSIDFVQLGFNEAIDAVIDQAKDDRMTASFVSAVMTTFYELVHICIHECGQRDPHTIAKLVTDLTMFFIRENVKGLFEVRDAKLFMEWCNSHISQMILEHFKGYKLDLPKNVLIELALYDEVVLQRTGWFWNDFSNLEEAKKLLLKFPKGAFLVCCPENLFSSSQQNSIVSAFFLFRVKNNGIMECNLRRESCYWEIDGSEEVLRSRLLVNLIESLFRSTLLEYRKLLFPVSKWIHEPTAAACLTLSASEKVLYDVELRQSQLNRALEMAQAEFAAEQSSIQTARNNDTLRGLSQLTTLYEQQRSRLLELRAQSKTSDEEAEKFEQALKLLETRLESFANQRENLEKQLLTATSASFASVQTVMSSELKSASLDAIQLRATLQASPGGHTEAFSDDSDAWLAPEGIDRQEAELLLANKNDGSFLVRHRSASGFEGAVQSPFAISFRWNSNTHHIVVYHRCYDEESPHCHGFSLLALNKSRADFEEAGSLFPTLPSLVSFYKTHPLPIKNQDSPGYGAMLASPLLSQ